MVAVAYTLLGPMDSPSSALNKRKEKKKAEAPMLNSF